MHLEILASNFLTPPVLFFFLGMAAVLCKSDLEIPKPFPKVLSLFLLFAIGFKGGVELSHSPLSLQIVLTLLAAVGMAVLVPIWSFFFLRVRLDANNAAAIAATYGSISAVTFITAAAFLQAQGVEYGGHMVAAMALMESPAIVASVILLRLTGKNEGEPTRWGELLRDAFLNGSVFLLVGSLLVGAITGERGMQDVAPLTESLFKGVLCLFLLDMGIVAARRLSDLRRAGTFLIGFALLTPLVNGFFGLALAYALGLGHGDALLFIVLCASASYIAVPAAMRLAVPDANPSLYVTMALALTFPFNVLVGIPFYYFLVRLFWS